MTSKSDRGRGGHWERYWAETDDVSQMLGGEGQREALSAHWQSHFASLPPNAGGAFLEIASGAAPVLKMAVARDNEIEPRIAVCTDVSDLALAAARRVAPQLRTVVCEAAGLPFRARAFSMIVSQFGVEYASLEGFAAAAEALAPGGALAVVAHIRAGAIERECAENNRILASIEASGVIDRLQAALEVSYAPAANRGDRRRAEAADSAFLSAWRSANARLQKAPPSEVRNLMSRYLSDMARLMERRSAYAPQQALAWVEGVGLRLSDSGGRMTSMIAAALDETAIATLKANFEREGLGDFSAEPLYFGDAGLPAAWWIRARRQL